MHRQALAGMLWTKQYYYFDVEKWLEEHRSPPADPNARQGVANTEWFHMLNADIISMPDKWEYPWYAAWDLAFHTVALSLVDFDFAKEQLLLMLRNLYFHPNGQIPAYEWNSATSTRRCTRWLRCGSTSTSGRSGEPARPEAVVSTFNDESSPKPEIRNEGRFSHSVIRI